MTPRAHQLGAFLAAALTLVIVSACGSSSSSSSSQSSAPPATTSAAAATSSASGTSSAPATASKSPITVVAVGDESGPTKEVDLPHLIAIRGAAAYFNAHGGIDGHHVVVQVLDDAGNPATAAAVTIKRLSSGAPPAVISAGNQGDEARR